MKYALITGACINTGVDIVEKFLSEGWGVVFTGRRQASVDEARASYLEKFPEATVIGYAIDSLLDERTVDEKSVDALVNAKSIYVIGLGSSASLASSLNHSLRMIFDNVKLLEASSADEIFAQIMNISKGDVIIAISFPRYSRKLITAVNYAKDSGATVIALTDSTASPIAAFADNLLVARSDMASFADSLIAPLSVINALVVAVSRKKQDELRVRLHQLEKIWDEYNVYDTNR